MSLKIDRVQLEIIVKQDQARQEMIKLEQELRSANKELNKIKKQFGENSDEYKAQQKVIRELKQKYDDLFNEIGIGHLSIKELGNRQRELNNILKNMDPSIPEWKKYNDQLKAVNARIKELRGQAQETGFSLSKMADGFNRYGAMAASVIASLTGVALTARKCVDEFAEMEEAEAQVIKYTGLSKEAVKELNEEFKQMDTRTPREKLNALAGDAGRLGITTLDAARDFVDGANIINVALGEDLGEDAVKNIGKLAQMFGEDKEKGLRGAMLATGSAVNALGQSSSAAENYIVGFTARVAGAGKQAKVAQADIMGYASVLDQNMQQQEMAATAFQTLMMKMFQEPAKFADIAGKSVEEFTTLINTDANGAILQLLDTLNKKGGLEKLAPIFKEMGLDGVRASGVISTLAGKIDDIRKAQEVANEAYRDGTSVVKEYNVQNNTVQAQLDKAKKHFKDIRVELGEQLLPVMKYMVTTGSMTIKGLSSMISTFSKHKATIIAVTATIAAYTVAVNASVIADKLKVFWTEKLIVSTRTLWATLKANPWGIVATGAALLLGYLIDMHRAQEKVTVSMKSMEKVQSETEKQFNDQAAKVDMLNKTMRDGNVAYDRRLQAIEELKRIIPNYNGMLTDEGKLINDNTAAINQYLASLEKQIKLKAAQEELEELYKQKRSLEKTEGEQDDAYWEVRQQNTLSGYNRNGLIAKISRLFGTESEDKALKALQKTRKELTQIDQAIADVSEEIKSSDLVIDVEVKDPEPCPKCGKIPCVCNAGDASGLDKELRAREELLIQQMQQERNLWKEEHLAQQHTEEEYNQAMADIDMQYLFMRKALYEQYGKDTSAIQSQIYDKMIADANRIYQAEQAAAAKQQQTAFSAIDDSYSSDKLALKQAYINGDIRTEEEYRAKLLETERDYLERKRAMQKEFGLDTSDTDAGIAEADYTAKQDDKQKKRDEGFKAVDNATSFAEEISILQAMRDADLISFEEYQEEMNRIAEEKSKQREEITNASLQVVSQAASAASQVFSALQDAEISKVTSKYDKQIAAAKKAGKDTTKLEEEKEAAINGIKKKYADKQFAAAVLQVTATTAVTAMEAYKAMAGIPVVGPALGAVAAAAAIAAGAAQIAVAKTQRDEAKGLYSGGYSDEYVEGFTRSGNPTDVAGVIPVHKNEFVTNHDGVANPHVRQFLDVFDAAQKNGTIRMINTTQILEQVRTRSGRFSGGYTTEGDSPTPSAPLTPAGGITPEVRTQIVTLLIETNRLLELIEAKELIIDSRKVRDGIKRVEDNERRVSRGK